MRHGEVPHDADGGPVTAGSLRYQPGLDGLRGLAVAAVLAFHDGRLQGGFLGVSTFFTLSGYLITRLLLGEWRANGGRISLRRFYTRRVRRLLPAALAGIVIAAAVTVALHDAQTSRDFPIDSVSAIANVANWRFLWSGRSYANLFATPSPLQHYWSLSVEEQFYLVLAPVIVAVLALGRGRRVVIGLFLAALGAASFVDGWFAVGHGIDRAYYGTDTRALEFLVGAVLAVVMTERVLGRRTSRAVASLGPVALVALVWATTQARVTDTGLFHGGLLAYALGGCAVMLAACEPGPVRALCACSPVRQLGRISYGVYVYHWPLFLWLSPARTRLAPLELTALRLAATIAVATVSFVFVEQPIREGRRIVRGGRWIAVPAATATVVLCVLMVAAVAPQPTVTFAPTQSAAAILSASRAAILPTTTVPAPAAAPPGTRTRAATGAATGAIQAQATAAITPAPLRRVLIVGDSVALTLGRGIERWGAKHGVLVWNGGVIGCALLTGVPVRGYWGVADRPADECHSRESFPTVIGEFKPQVVIVLYGAWDVYDASFDHGHTWSSPGQPAWDHYYEAEVADTAKRLSAGGARVLWLAPPCFAALPGAADANARWYQPARVNALRAIDRAVAAQNGMTVSDIVRNAGCPVDFSARPDGVHYSDAGADAAAALLGPEIEAVAR